MKGNYWKRYGKRSHDSHGLKKGRKGRRQSYRAIKAKIKHHLDKILHHGDE